MKNNAASRSRRGSPSPAAAPPSTAVQKPKSSSSYATIGGGGGVKGTDPDAGGAWPEEPAEIRTGFPAVMKYAILAMICALAFFIRLFAVVRYESVIHEFDPYFNFRTTKFLATEGFLDFLNWFDDRGWYPLGRTIGGTIYPGLMATAASFYWILHALHITINIRNV
ncbi:unnamed protein product [Ectocarpus sp. 13 AM-2016]